MNVARKVESYCGTGRRKEAVARVRHFRATAKMIEMAGPLKSTSPQVLHHRPSAAGAHQHDGKYDVVVNVDGGGITGQAGAIRHGIARKLCSRLIKSCAHL